MNQEHHKKPTEFRQFSIHPSILKTLINEQAGSLNKALTELIMNCVDAGATKIVFDIDVQGNFTLSDNGSGFTSREEIEQFFEMFGTPHSDGDAYYGRFRIGRGQIMSYASTIWRSGFYEMRVDLNGKTESFGYELIEHKEAQPGCSISGKIYDFDEAEYHLNFSSEGYGGGFDQKIKFVPVPILVNGELVNDIDASYWDTEDEFAQYKFERNAHFMNIYNRGIYVCGYKPSQFGTGGIINTKLPLAVNLARNAVLEQKCEVWRNIRNKIVDLFSLKITKQKKLNSNETALLMHDLLYTKKTIDYHTAEAIRKIKFIPDIFGDLRTPDQMLSSSNFTFFDEKHTTIAERIQNQNIATVLVPEFFRMFTDFDTPTISHMRAIQLLRQKLYFSDDDEIPTFLNFLELAQSLSETFEIIDEKELNIEEAVVLKAIRSINWLISGLVNNRYCDDRTIIVGKSDLMHAWTDGKSYIAINRAELKGIRGTGFGRGASGLIALMIHEYLHREVSTGDHIHDLLFYRRFHDLVLSLKFGTLTDKLFRRYIKEICDNNIVPSGYHGAHLRGLFVYKGKIPSRLRNGRTGIM